MNEHRIYGQKRDIDTDSTLSFYDSRAKNIDKMDCPYTAVLLGDQDPKHAQEWNTYEKENILPLLNIDRSSSVLDIGCGIGRWGESVIPVAGYYLGADFSSEMIKTAKARCNFDSDNYDFINASFQQLLFCSPPPPT